MTLLETGYMENIRATFDSEPIYCLVTGTSPKAKMNGNSHLILHE